MPANKQLNWTRSIPSIKISSGGSLSQMGRFAEALPYAERAVEAEPTNFDYHYNLAFTQDKLHHYKRSRG